MRQQLLRAGADELSYEIRGIVKKAELLQGLGVPIYWENIGDPIQKNLKVPEWMKDTLRDILKDDQSYGYSHSKGLPETRAFLADLTNNRKGVQITADDITFFNGLGDAIAKIYQYLLPTSRVIGPSPAYSTHSSAEAAHANHEPITYQLVPEDNWLPDMDDLYNKVKYNPGIVGILIINPDNPTGMVYPKHILDRFVAIAREFDLFIICDEIYLNITYNNSKAYALSEFIGEVPGIALKGISKEFPWPGARCGWAEYYNRQNDKDFDRLCQTLDNAKMIEVSSTKLPQLAIPKIMSDKRYPAFRRDFNDRIAKRSKLISELLADIPYIYFNETKGAFYNTIIFKNEALNNRQYLLAKNAEINSLIDDWITPEMPLDQRFVYYLLATTGICVVPISSFCSDLLGFRVTLLEENEETLLHIFQTIKSSLIQYIESSETEAIE
ncbi:MAG: pyridoxal phosphate-dependent aminotransferase [Bacteroidota bacterium]